ncbi:helical backbone metal receptor [Chitiniphilus shinanonensis]|uniref:helical backbone metal receptor n=1 Tax=Chitiniphilus shinanonensis TaxID=553088 RepID=UPI00305B715B
MKSWWWLIACCVGWLSPAWSAITVRDDAGRVVSLERAATRVVTLAPHATELVASLAPNLLVAVDRYSNYPPAVRKLPQVGDYVTINLEALIALKPDLVVLWEGDAAAAAMQRLDRLAIPVFVSRPASAEGIATNLERLGRLLGRADQARASATKLRKQMRALRQQYAAKPPVRVFLQLGSNPMFTVSRKAFLGQALADCGATTPYQDEAAISPQASLEVVLQFAPRLILVDGPQDAVDAWQRFPQLPAVAHQAVQRFGDDRFVRPGPRFVEGMAELCRRVDSARVRKIP